MTKQNTKARGWLAAFTLAAAAACGGGPNDGPGLLATPGASSTPDHFSRPGVEVPETGREPGSGLDETSRDEPGSSSDGSNDQTDAAAEEYAWVTITWDSAPTDSAVNLDPHVIDARGVEIYYLNTGGSEEEEGRFADHPECRSFDCSGDEDQPRESIFWELDKMAPGPYEAWVTNASDRQGSFEIEIVAGDYRVNESATIAANGESSHWTWEFGEQADPNAPCLQQLDQLGVQYTPITISEGDCVVDDAVMIEGPLNGITYKVDYAKSTTRFRTACRTALALHELGNVLQSHDIVEAFHVGSYNCRNTRGGSNLSQHAYGLAMDLAGFATSSGKEYSVVGHWEHGTDSPQTEEGKVLYQIAHAAHDQRIFNIVLTPEYNADHDDHFHMDLTSGAHSIQSTQFSSAYELSSDWEGRCEH